ncbi:MAG: D-Ala-D-Ala carboxypeptidase family metallohydrolase [Rhodospirillales bacterium]|nr:D-Ala-D-Ala carboxypeptidase family metallohydrolase [Rhodospirillales bacterium]
MLDHFSRSELACPTTDELRLATGFGERLRVELDAPIYLSSACRSPSHNAKVGGHPRSLHLTVNEYWGTGGCCAVDAVATDGEYRAKIISQALDQDWSVVFHSCRSVVLPIADRKDISWTKPPDMVKPVKNINNWLRTAI